MMQCTQCEKDDPRECLICQDMEINEHMLRLMEEIRRLKNDNEILKQKIKVIKTMVDA